MSFEMMRTLIVLIMLGNIAALIAGVALVVAPRRVVKGLGLKSSHPMSLRRLTKPLEKFFDIDGPMLRYSRVLGVTMVAAGAFVLIKWSLFVIEMKSTTTGAFLLARLFPGIAWHAPLWEVLWVAVSAMVILGALFAIFVGTLALVRAQTLKRVAKLSNRWVSTRQAMRSKSYYGFDRWIAGNPQAWGAAIALLSLYTLGMIVWFTR